MSHAVFRRETEKEVNIGHMLKHDALKEAGIIQIFSSIQPPCIFFSAFACKINTQDIIFGAMDEFLAQADTFGRQLTLATRAFR